MAKGEVSHIEFPADDPQRAMRFYAAVAGWDFGQTDAFSDYWLFRSGDGAGGAIGVRGKSVGRQLRIYIEVDSLDDAVRAAEANGGVVVEPATTIGGGMGRFAVVRDPEGSEVGLFERPTQPAS